MLVKTLLNTWGMTEDDVDEKLKLVELSGKEDVDVVEDGDIGDEGGVPHREQQAVRRHENHRDTTQS